MLKKLSQLLSYPPLTGQLAQFLNEEIEVDVHSFQLAYAVSFTNCSFKYSESSDIILSSLYAPQCVRFENCDFQIGFCVWGQDGAAGYIVLDKKGPNVFFDNCRFVETTLLVRGLETNIVPQVQLSGFLDHCRISSKDKNNVQISISQARFSKLEIIGACRSFQMVEFLGDELFLREFYSDFIWIRDSLVSNVKYIDIDLASVKHISEKMILTLKKQSDSVELIKKFLEVFSSRKEGEKFAVFNNLLSQVAPANTLTRFIIYRFFKNFYALMPCLYLMLATIILFTLLYFPFEMNCKSAFLSSLFSLSGNPYFDKAESSLYLFLKSSEAFLGLIYVILISWILGRKYANYL